MGTLGGCWGGGRVTFLWYSVLTRGLLYIENCKTANLDSYRHVVLSYKHHRKMSTWYM